LKNGYADGNLIAKWKKQGYDKVCWQQRTKAATDPGQLCCLVCIQTKATNFNSTCICRVPRDQLKEDHSIQCINCGCRGCATGD
jgi:bud site selection protein 31